MSEAVDGESLPTADEVMARLLQTMEIRNKWEGNPGYRRTLAIDMAALAALYIMLKSKE